MLFETSSPTNNQSNKFSKAFGAGFAKLFFWSASTLLLAAILLFWSVPAIGAPISIVAKYVINVGGTIIANVDITLDDDSRNYTLDLEARVSGLGNLVASGNANINVTGSSQNNQLFGNDFRLQTNSPQGQSEVIASFEQRNISAFYSTPPLPPHFDQVPLQRSQLKNVNDMLSAFIIKSDRLGPQICDRTLKIFTGVERFDLQMRYATSETATSARTGYQGPVILCQLKYNPIAGHYASSEITNYLKTSERILIWYAPVVGSDVFIPYRVLIGTSFGDMSMVLTNLSQ